MPYNKEKSMVEKDKSRSLNEVQDFGEDLGGVNERKEEIGERVIENEDEIEEDYNDKEGKSSTESGTQTIHSLVSSENLPLEIVLLNYLYYVEIK